MKKFFEKFKDSFLKIGKKDMNREKESPLLSLNCYPESKSQKSYSREYVKLTIFHVLFFLLFCFNLLRFFYLKKSIKNISLQIVTPQPSSIFKFCQRIRPLSHARMCNLPFLLKIQYHFQSNHITACLWVLLDASLPFGEFLSFVLVRQVKPSLSTLFQHF